nr:MAG TPA: flavoprotein monooxygenase-binding protein, monooxygenase, OXIDOREDUCTASE [Caudoviricetes sp.]
MVYCKCESWETSQKIHKKRTPVMFGVLLRYAGLINIIIGGGPTC